MSVRKLSPALEKHAQKEINENPNRISTDVLAIRDWLKKQPHLHNVQPNDQWIVSFLRGCKFSLERAKEKLDMYYTMRSIVPEFFSHRDPSSKHIQDILKLGVFLPLKKSSSENAPRVCIIRLGVMDSKKVSLTELIKVSFMVTEIMMLEDDNFSVSGEEVIVDMKDVGVNILSQWTPALAKKIMTCFEKALPVRLRGNHIMNTPTGFEAAYTVFKMFLSEKLKKRIQVHNQDFKGLYKSIPKSILPVEYGGDDGSVVELIEHWRKKIENHRQWYLDEESQKSEESKRSGTPVSSSELFGVEGSFRKLEVD